MLFNSLSFAVFLPIVFAAYWLCPPKHRWIVLLVSSYYFYMSWNVKYLALIVLTTFVSYLAARLMESFRQRRKLFLTLALIAGLGTLFFFKYFNFASSSLTRLLGLLSMELDTVTLNVLLPVGISFYTFQTLGYVIDVYRGTVKAERHFGRYAVFVSFFPQLISGPIGRAGSLLPQLRCERGFDYGEAVYGLKLMAWGFFKKLVIADALAVYTDMVFDMPSGYAGFALVLASLFYTIQIYCDFSGYTDIAIGTARLFGVRLMNNFACPYFSSSVKEFWSRWHISLTSWFRDYLYFPLGGSRISKARTYLNLMIVFLLSGLWHGAAWTFVIWGGLHGLARAAEKALGLDAPGSKRFAALRTVLVFAFCSLAWTIFRSHSMSDALYIFRASFEGIGDLAQYIQSGFSALELSGFRLVTLCIFVSILTLFDYFSLKNDVIDMISKKSAACRYAIYFALILTILFFGLSGETAFVYFQF